MFVDGIFALSSDCVMLGHSQLSWLMKELRCTN